ncbi:MAG TPA: glycosyltransferase family 4 protein [Lacipirellulaceae bacterium]|nr:glycosyltransferase family 4 protein [Lacipirellulaceae bacterium]
MATVEIAWVTLAGALTAAIAMSSLLALMLRPLLSRYALARPNARSSHSAPTPQGGGIAVIIATTVVLAGTAVLVPSSFHNPTELIVLFACATALAVLGATDDIHPLETLPRLAVQSIAVLFALAYLPPEVHILRELPWWLDRALLVFAVLWFVNLVNFMDGVDWMTVVEVVPVTAALALFGFIGALPSDATLVAAALCGAVLGFAPFNRPVARLFLGDVGSLPIGLLVGWLLVLLANEHLAAALLLPLYYVADATITLLRRLLTGERVLQAHRSHFYQRALDGGVGVSQIVGRVFLVNIALVGLAAFTILNVTPAVQALSIIVGSILVAGLLLTFSRIKKA